MEWDPWPRSDYLGLARYVTPEAKRCLSLNVNRCDLTGEDKDVRYQIVKAIYDALLEKRIYYDPPRYDPSSFRQSICTPAEILNERLQVTCLDLATLFCGLCLGYDLLSTIVVIKEHALAVVSLENWRGTTYRRERSLFDGGILTDPDRFREFIQLIDEHAYLAIECTGFAYSEKLAQMQDERYPESIQRVNGVLEFQQAVRAGRKQLDLQTRPFQAAIDIDLAHKRVEPHSFVAIALPPKPFLAPSLPEQGVVGREDLLRDLKQYLFTRQTLTLTALDGLPGAGKTTLAIALAHDPEVRKYFSDGVLWAGLGKDVQKESDIVLHLDRWARMLGISSQDLGKSSPEVVESLLIALKDPNRNVRSWGAISLGKLGKSSPEVAESLLAVLEGSDEWVGSRSLHSAAAAYLGNLQTSLPAVKEGLLAALKDPDENVRHWAVDSLKKLEISSPEIISALFVIEEKEYLDEFGKSSYLEAFKKLDEYIYYKTAGSRGILGKPLSEMISNLLAVLGDPDERMESGSLHSMAVACLGALGKSSSEVIGGLLAALEDPDGNVRYWAVNSLGELEASSPEVVRALLTILKNPDEGAGFLAAKILSKLGNSSSEVAGELLTALKDPNEEVRSRAIRSLVESKAPSPEVVSTLFTTLKDADEYASIRAAGMLGELGSSSPEVVEGLLIILRDPDEKVRSKVTRILRYLESPTSEVMKILSVALKDPEKEVRSSVAYILGRALTRLEPPPPEVIEGLLAALKDSQKEVRSEAAEGLFAALKDAEKNVDKEVYPEVIERWGKLGSY